MPVRIALALLCLPFALPAAARAATADVSVSMSGPPFAVVGAEAAYDVTIANAGPSVATGIALIDAIPAGARLVRTAGDGSCTSGSPLRCTFSSVAAGGRAELTIVLSGSEVGRTLHHVVDVTATTTTDPTTDDREASVDTTITPPSVAPPPVALIGPACGNQQRGTRDDDVLVGTVFGDTLYGLDGSDLLRGMDGDDCLWGGEGPDVLDGDGGNDALWGGNGRDRLVGGAGADRLYGGLKRDVLIGGDGDDQLVAGFGRDLVRAGVGNDVVFARDGSRDVVECGPGADRAVVDRRDRVVGCEAVVRARSGRRAM